MTKPDKLDEPLIKSLREFFEALMKKTNIDLLKIGGVGYPIVEKASDAEYTIKFKVDHKNAGHMRFTRGLAITEEGAKKNHLEIHGFNASSVSIDTNSGEQVIKVSATPDTQGAKGPSRAALATLLNTLKPQFGHQGVDPGIIHQLESVGDTQALKVR